MRFYNRQHRHYCGIDLHVKTMYVCILDAGGQVLVHRNVDGGGVPRGGGFVPRGSGRRRRMHVHVVLARGSAASSWHRSRTRGPNISCPNSASASRIRRIALA